MCVFTFHSLCRIELVSSCGIAASNVGALNAEGNIAAPDGNGNAGGDGSGAGSSDVRSDSSSSSGSSSSEPRGGAIGRDAAVDLPLAPLGGGGDVGVGAGASPAQPLVGEQCVAAEAPVQVGDVDNARRGASASDGHDGQDKPVGQERQGAAGAGAGAGAAAEAAADKEVLEGRLKGEVEHADDDGDGVGVGGGGGTADEEGSETMADAESSSTDKESGAGGASAASSALGEPQDAGVETEAATAVVQENNNEMDDVAGGDSVSSEPVGKSVGSASASASASSQSTAPASAGESVETMIEALPPGFVRCPGCPMVRRNEVE